LNDFYTTVIIIISWAKGKSTACDVTVLDTFAESHLSAIAADQGAAAKQAADNQTAMYQGLEKTHIFFPVAIETAGSWSQQATELVQEIERRPTVITENSTETTFLFQRLSMALPKCGRILKHFPARLVSHCKKK